MRSAFDQWGMTIHKYLRALRVSSCGAWKKVSYKRTDIKQDKTNHQSPPKKTKIAKQYGPSKRRWMEKKTTIYFSFWFSQATWQKAVRAAIQSGFLCSNQLSRIVPFWWAPHDLRWCSHITLQPGWRLKGRFQLKIDELSTKDGEKLMLSTMELNHYDIVHE